MMNMYCAQQVYSAGTPSHQDSFSSESCSAATSYDAFSPVSGRSSPIDSQRLDSMASVGGFNAAAVAAAAAAAAGPYQGVGPLDLTPPPSATVPNFFMGMPPNPAVDGSGMSVAATTSAANASAMTATTGPQDMASGYISSSAFPSSVASSSRRHPSQQQLPLPPLHPVTPGRHNSSSSSCHSSVASPTSPTAAHLLSSYPSSISSMSSVASSSGSQHNSIMCGSASQHGDSRTDAYPFPEVPRQHHQYAQDAQQQYRQSQRPQHDQENYHQQHHHQHQQQQQQQQQQQREQEQHQQHQQHMQQQQHHHQEQQQRNHPSPPFMFPTPSSQTLNGDCGGGEISPSEFYWQNGIGRADSPPISFFDERPALPPLPPSATLKSTVVKCESVKCEPTSPLDDVMSLMCSPASPVAYSTVGAGVGGTPVARSAGSSFSSTSSMSAATRRRLFMENIQSKTHALHRRLSSSGGGSRQGPSSAACSPTSSNYPMPLSPNGYHYSMPQVHLVAPEGGDIIVRNGIQVSKIASGAFRCLVPDCPSRPFKRSEHLKRHVITHHENKDAFPCEFCGRCFNRKDNWRSHLKLHTVSRGKNARTDYFPHAVRLYEEEMRKVSKCRPRKTHHRASFA